MELRRLFKGSVFSIDAIVLDNGSCPAEEFLEQIKINDPGSHKSMVNVITRHANYGTLRNKRKSKVIEGRENLLEFKTDQGDRLVYFYLPGYRTMLTHGFHKGAVASAEYDRAEVIRDKYCNEVENGNR